jgi:hypothetical protein
LMLTPLALRVISRIRRLNRSRDFGAIVRLMSGPAVLLIISQSLPPLVVENSLIRRDLLADIDAAMKLFQHYISSPIRVIPRSVGPALKSRPSRLAESRRTLRPGTGTLLREQPPRRTLQRMPRQTRVLAEVFASRHQDITISPSCDRGWPSCWGFLVCHLCLLDCAVISRSRHHRHDRAK